MDSNTNSTLHEVRVLIVLYIYTNEVQTNIVLSNNNNMWLLYKKLQ